MNSFFRWLFVCVLLAGLAAACAPATPQVQLTFYKRGYTEGSENSTSISIAKAVKAFETRHPEINVTVVGVGYDEQGDALLLDALAQGKVNVMSVNSFELPQFARAGYLSPIDDFLTPQDKADFYANALNAATVDEKIYAWPLWVTAIAMYGNPAIFTERGVRVPDLENPWTWEEFTQALEKLTFTRADGSQVYAFTASSLPEQVVYQPFLYMDGGRILSPDGRRFTQNSPESLSALEKIWHLKREHSQALPNFGNISQADARAEFEAGRAAMLLDTPSFIPDMQAKGVAFVAFPPPMGETGKIVTSGGFGMYGVVIHADPQVMDAAHLFANYLTSSQVAQDVSGYQLAPGLRRSNTIYASDAPRALVSKLVAYGVYESPVNIPAEVHARYEQALNAIALGQTPPLEAMNAIAPEYQAALDALAP